MVDETQGRPRWSKSRREGGLGDAKQAARLLRSLDSADIRSALRGSFAGSRPAFQGFSTRHAPLPSPGSGLAHRAAEPKKSPASDGIGHGKCTGPGLSRGLSACAAIAALRWETVPAGVGERRAKAHACVDGVSHHRRLERCRPASRLGRFSKRVATECVRERDHFRGQGRHLAEDGATRLADIERTLVQRALRMCNRVRRTATLSCTRDT